MALYNYVVGDKTYVINIEIGKTIIKMDIDNTIGLLTQIRQRNFFADDEEHKIIINYYLDYLSPTGEIVKSIPYKIITTDTPAILNSVGDIVTPAGFQYSYWDAALGVPILRKIISNSMLQNYKNLPGFFDPAQILSPPNPPQG